MAENQNAVGGADERGPGSVPGPRKRWRVMVVGKTATSVVPDSSAQLATIVPDRGPRPAPERRLHSAPTE